MNNFFEILILEQVIKIKLFYYSTFKLLCINLLEKHNQMLPISPELTFIYLSVLSRPRSIFSLKKPIGKHSYND